MTRTFSVFALFVLTLAGSGDAAAKSRAVRPPAPQCSYSLAPSFGTTVAAAGVSAANLAVIANPSTCVSWNAYSLTDWVTVSRSGNAVLVDVAPNPTTTPRSATILVAGIRYTFSQEGAAVVNPPVAGNVLLNAGFDRDLSFWIFPSQFPNGPGNAAWSSFDSANNASSGSIRLRNTKPIEGTHTFQHLQCAAVDPGEVYQYGGKFFATSATAGTAVYSIVEYVDEDCVTPRGNQPTISTPRIRTPGTWQTQTETMRMGSTTRSVYFVIGSRATTDGTFEIFMDDVFLRRP